MKQNSSQKQAKISVPGWLILPPQLLAHVYDGSKPSVVVVGTRDVAVVVVFGTRVTEVVGASVVNT